MILPNTKRRKACTPYVASNPSHGDTRCNELIWRVAPGNTDHLSARTVVIEIAELTRTAGIADQALSQLGRLDTLMRATTDTVDEATSPHGFWYRAPNWAAERFGHVSALLRLMEDEIDRLRMLLMTADAA